MDADLAAVAPEPGLARLGLSHHALKPGGGFERYAATLVRGLHVHGLRPAFIAREFDVRMPEVHWVEPVRVRMTGVPHAWRDHVFDWRIGPIKRRLGVAPLISCNPTRHADIAVCGGTHPGYLLAMGDRPNLRDRWKVSLEHAFYERAAIIVAHSRAMKDEIAEHYGITGPKVQLLYPPVDSTRFSPPVDDAQRAALRRRFDFPDDRAVFLLASTSHRRKGLGQLAAYFANTDLPATLVVAGRPLGGSPANVRWIGYSRDIENLYRAVDFTIMASTYEPFGLVGIESLLCGTPVLLASGVGCSEVIEADARIDFAPGDPGALGEAVRNAVAQWRTDTHRIAMPARALRYDPSVAAHVDALLALVRQWRSRHGDRVADEPGTHPAHA
jgi:glycosyltransferase involved in cell wall biosynthesis